LSNKIRKYRRASKILTPLPSLPLKGRGEGRNKEGFKNIGEMEEGL
jgi:hypothetical protein